jgi:hypothetical protein
LIACCIVIFLSAIAFFVFSITVICKVYKRNDPKIKEIKIKKIVQRHRCKIKSGGRIWITILRT